MKIKDLIFLGIFALIFVPFFIFPDAYEWFKTMTTEQGLLMSILKFSILATLGECLGLRIKTGKYYFKGFGILPRAIVWGFLGMFIFFAFAIFKSGVSVMLENVFGVDGAVAALKGDFTTTKLMVAFFVSAFLNIIFAPVMMTFHKITDTHIDQNGGRVSCLLKCIPMGEIMTNINWKVQWNFVFKRTIPFFWIPAHTITFILPTEFQILFAALLGVVLGVILAVASQMGKKA
jgi:hypothetical protein